MLTYFQIDTSFVQSHIIDFGMVFITTKCYLSSRVAPEYC